MSQKTLNLCLERYNFVKFGETTKSSHTVLCINNANNANSGKYRLTPTELASKHGEGFVFTLNYDFDRPLFTIAQKSYTIDGTSGNIVFEGIDPLSKDGSKYLRKVTVAPVKLSDNSYLLEVTGDEYLRIGTTGAALGDEELASLNEKIVTAGGIEKSVTNVGGKQVLKLDAGGPAGAKEIVYFDVDPSDPPSGIYAAITAALSNGKEPVIKNGGAVYFYSATGTDEYVFVGGYKNEAVGYTEFTVSSDDSVTSKSVDDKVFDMYLLYKTDPASPGDPPGDEDSWVCDANKHVITKGELVAAHADCRYFILNNDVEPGSNSRKYFAAVTNISNAYVQLRFYMLEYSGEGAADFYQKTVSDDSEGRLYVSDSYQTYLAGTNQAVLVSEPQNFDSTQKAQGRDNIGAAAASDVTALQTQVSSLSNVSAYSVKGEATVAQLNAGPSGIQAGWAYQLSDSGTLTEGSLAVVAGDTVAWDGTKWFPLVKSDYYATKTYAQKLPSISFRTVVDNLQGLTTREYNNSDGQIEILSNRYIASDGSLIEESYSSVSDYIPISGGINSIEFCNRDVNGRLGVAFYDTNKQFISGVNAGATGTLIVASWYYSNVVPQIPEGAVYMRVAGNVPLRHPISFTCEEKIVPSPGVDYMTAEAISRNTLKSVEGIVDNEVEYSAIESNNYAIGTNGSPVSSANSSISDYIKITGPIHEITYCNHTGDSLGVAFYDINKNFISGVDAGATGTLISYDWYYSSVVPQIPEGAVYMRIAGNRALGHSLYLKMVQTSVESAKAVQPDVGYEFFTYNVDCSVDDTDNSLQTANLQEEPVISTDNGLIMLPSGYSASGKPCQLVAFNHGAGGIVTDNSASGWMSSSIKLLLKRGYAVLFVNGIPQAFRNTKYCNRAQNGAAAHMAGIIFLRSFKKAYDYVVGKYNVTREIVALGESMGGLAALNIALSGIVPVRAVALDAPIIDLYSDAYFSGGWSSGTLGAGTFGIIAWMYQFRGCDFENDTYTIDGTTRSMAELPSYPEDCEALWNLNRDRVAAFNAYLTANALVNIPDHYGKALRCPCKIWFGTDDNVNKLSVAENFVALLRNAGTLIWLRTIPTSTHCVWNMTTTSGGVDTSIVEDGLTCGVCGVELCNWIDSIV